LVQVLGIGKDVPSSTYAASSIVSALVGAACVGQVMSLAEVFISLFSPSRESVFLMEVCAQLA
jgi:hypothetical protein